MNTTEVKKKKFKKSLCLIMKPIINGGGKAIVAVCIVLRRNIKRL